MRRRKDPRPWLGHTPLNANDTSPQKFSQIYYTQIATRVPTCNLDKSPLERIANGTLADAEDHLTQKTDAFSSYLI